MKKLLISLMLGFMPMTAMASVDSVLNSVWQDVRTNGSITFFQSLTPMVAKNLNKNEWLQGAGSSFLNYRYVSLDFQAFELSSASSIVYPGAGISVHLGEFLYNTVPFIKSAADSLGKAAPMIAKGTIGVGAARRFSDGTGVIFAYGGIIAHFGPGGK